MHHCDVAIIGGGIVGLATAYRFQQRYPDARLIVIEKESSVGAHQSSHNSGVLHSGIYYKPGSERARNCRAGKLAMVQFCREHDIPFDLCGKVIVAVTEDEVPRLQEIFARGQANGVACHWIDRQQLAEIEPHAQGVSAIHVPEAGIVSYKQVCLRLAEVLLQGGATLQFGSPVVQLRSSETDVAIKTERGEVRCRAAVTCGGLHADRLVRLSGHIPIAPIVPFRGEFFHLRKEAEHLCRGLIYPTPNPAFPFLGVHFTRTIQGGVECGPNAVLAFARQGYAKTDFNLRDLWEALVYPGFQKMARVNWRTGLGEMWRSWNKAAFVRALQRLVPEIRTVDLRPAPAGVRAQALGPDGKLLDDFVVQRCDRVLHVLNAPSPAATASLNIGSWIVDQLAAAQLC